MTPERLAELRSLGTKQGIIIELCDAVEALQTERDEAREASSHATAGHARSDSCFRILHERNDLRAKLEDVRGALDGEPANDTLAGAVRCLRRDRDTYKGYWQVECERTVRALAQLAEAVKERNALRAKLDALVIVEQERNEARAELRRANEHGRALVQQSIGIGKDRDDLRAKLAECVAALELLSQQECAFDCDAEAVLCPKGIAQRALAAAKGGG